MRGRESIGESLSKVFLNVGQGVIVAAILSGVFSSESSLLLSTVAFIIGLFTVFVGLYIQWLSRELGD